MPYGTPETLPTAYRCRRLRIPDDILWLEIVNGALVELIKEYNFEQVGAVTPQETAQVFQDMFFEYLEGEPCMLGAILPYATTNPPDYTLPCDGSMHFRVDYPALYAALDEVFIIDGVTFKTPDLSGRAIIGTGIGLDLTERVIGDSGGAEVHTLITSELPAHDHMTNDHTHTDFGHTHGYTYPTVNIDIEGVGVPDILGAGNPPLPFSTTIGYANLSDENVTVNPTGDDTPHNNMQPYHALRYCIVAR